MKEAGPPFPQTLTCQADLLAAHSAWRGASPTPTGRGREVAFTTGGRDTVP